MTLEAFIRKYGTATTSILLRNLAEKAANDVPLVEEMADDLHEALKHYVANSMPVRLVCSNDLLKT